MKNINLSKYGQFFILVIHTLYKTLITPYAIKYNTMLNLQIIKTIVDIYYIPT